MIKVDLRARARAQMRETSFTDEQIVDCYGAVTLAVVRMHGDWISRSCSACLGLDICRCSCHGEVLGLGVQIEDASQADECILGEVMSFAVEKIAKNITTM